MNNKVPNKSSIKKGDIEQCFPQKSVIPLCKKSYQKEDIEKDFSYKNIQSKNKVPYHKRDIEKGLPQKNIEHQILDVYWSDNDSSDDEVDNKVIESDNFIKSIEEFVKDKATSILLYIKTNYENSMLNK
jgi:hypothetical protein